MLPSMTAAILFARRGRGCRSRGSRSPPRRSAKQTGAATLLPVLYLIARGAREARRRARCSLGFAIPTALVALAVGPAQLLYWTVLGNGSYVGMKTMTTVVLALFLLHDAGMWPLCNLPLLWKLPSAWHDRKLVALDGERDTDLWLWRCRGRVLGRRSACASSVTTTCSSSRRSRCSPPARCRAAAGVVRSPARSCSRSVIGGRVLGRRLLLAPGRAASRTYESVSRVPRHHHQPRRPDLRVGQRAEIYWASERRPATRFLTTPSFLTGNHPGRPPDEADTGADTEPRTGRTSTRTSRAHPPQYFVDTSPAKVRGAQYYPISSSPPRARSSTRSTSYVVTIDGIDIYERK